MSQNLGKIKTGKLNLIKSKLSKKAELLKNRSAKANKIFVAVFCLIGVITVANLGLQVKNHIKAYAFAEGNHIVTSDLQVAEIKDTSKEKYFNNVLTAGFAYADIRAYVFDLYFKQNNSPLYGYGEEFVKTCDRYGAPKDCITVVAIARNETNLCKYHNSAEMKNCWGFGGAGIYRIKFDSFEQSIDRVTDVLVNQYGERYILDPSLMEGTFCGTADECIGWGSKIKYFMEEIDQFSEVNGFGRLSKLR